MPVVCLRCPPTCSSAAFWTEDTHDGGARQTAGHPARFTDLTTAGESLHAPVRVGMEDVRARAKPRLSTVRPISRLTRARTSSINLSSSFPIATAQDAAADPRGKRRNESNNPALLAQFDCK